MQIGERAEIRRIFTASDIARFAALTGDQDLPEGFVPEPLIGALFSKLLGMDLPGPGTGWLKQEFHHHARARVGRELRASVELSRLRLDKRLADLICQCHDESGEMLCDGRAVMILGPDTTLL